MRLLLLLCLLLSPSVAFAQSLTVFAAASLTDAMKDVEQHWKDSGHTAVLLSFGASSTLARQIEQGAPANLFASADETWMEYLATRKLIAADTRKSLLGNDLVLVVPASKPLHVTISSSFSLAGLLGPDGRLATGDPAHVPVGIYAEQALRKLGMWDSISPHLARTDAAVSPAVMIAGIFPADSHDPISYPFAVTHVGDTPEARAFLTYLADGQARTAFARRGFKVQ